MTRYKALLRLLRRLDLSRKPRVADLQEYTDWKVSAAERDRAWTEYKRLRERIEPSAMERLMRMLERTENVRTAKRRRKGGQAKKVSWIRTADDNRKRRQERRRVKTARRASTRSVTTARKRRQYRRRQKQSRRTA